MSGPSARRSVRLPAHMCARGVTSATPAPPCTCQWVGGSFSGWLGGCYNMVAVAVAAGWVAHGMQRPGHSINHA